MQPLVSTSEIVLLLFLLFYIYILGYKSGKKDEKNKIVTLKKDGYATIILPANILKKGRERSRREISFVQELLEASYFSKGNCSVKESFTEEEVILN